jgi:MYXO-CTERM domain-containing protein
VVETTTRLPLGKPLIADRDGPELQAVTGGLLLLLALGAAFQVRSLRRRSQAALIP